MPRLTSAKCFVVYEVVNNSLERLLASFHATAAAGEPAFLLATPDGAVRAALGEGDAPIRVGAMGYDGGGSFWRPAALLRARIESDDTPRLSGASSASPMPLAPDGDAVPTAAWCEAVAAALSAFESGRARKVVLARHRTVDAPAGRAFDAVETWQALRRANPGVSVFAVTVPGGVFVGATPERLVAARRGADGAIDMEADALAGTAPLSVSGDALLANPKERAEHAAVVDGLCAALSPLVDPGSLEVPSGPTLRRLPTLWHLHTPLRARLRPGVTLIDVVLALHPTPAVGGTPREFATRFQRHHEAFDRGPYAGPVGFLDDSGDGLFVVGIRSALLSGARATLYGGCGLVVGSEAGAEWRETSLKMETAGRCLRWVETPPGCRPTDTVGTPSAPEPGRLGAVAASTSVERKSVSP